MSKRWKLIRVVLMGAMLVWLLGMHFYIQYHNKREFVYNIGEESEDFEISFDVPKQWSEEAHGYTYGMQYDGTFVNNTYAKLFDWSVEISVPEDCRVDSYWNGELSYENDTIQIVPLEDIQIIDSNSSRTFGFILYSHSLDNIKDCTVTFHKRLVMKEFPMFKVWLGVGGILCVVLLINFFTTLRTKQLREKKEEFESIINQSFHMFANLIDAKDPYTFGHSRRVALYSKELAKRMGISEEDRNRLFYIALLHDIGKIGITDAILNKEDELTSEERDEIQRHVIIGGNVLKDFTAMEGIADGARYHHERYDGTGYGYGLKGEEIPLFARIIAVADSFDAMSSERCYKTKKDMQYIINELKEGSGTQFDPKVAAHMLDMIQDGVVPIDLAEYDEQYKNT